MTGDTDADAVNVTTTGDASGFTSILEPLDVLSILDGSLLSTMGESNPFDTVAEPLAIPKLCALTVHGSTTVTCSSGRSFEFPGSGTHVYVKVNVGLTLTVPYPEVETRSRRRNQSLRS